MVLALGLLAAVGSGVTAYSAVGPHGARLREDLRVRRLHAPGTDHVRLLIYDADGDGLFDTYAHMDGEMSLHNEVDADQDGVIEGWEYYYYSRGTVARVEYADLADSTHRTL